MFEPSLIEKHFKELVKELTERERKDLRFEARFLPVSEVSTQYFCEKKVEMERIYGRKERLEMRIGKEAHELLLKDTVMVKREQLLHEIYSGKPTLVREMRLIGKHEDIIIVGVPDAVLFYKRLPILLSEYKFSKKTVPFHDHHVQARLYCYLLHLMGWNTDRLRYALIMAPPELREDEELRTIPKKILKYPREDKIVFKTGKGNINVYINSFNLDEAVKELDWALEFWRLERPAMPTRKPAKCKACEFKSGCDSSCSKSELKSRLKVM